MKEQLHHTLCSLAGFILGCIVCALITWICPHGRTEADVTRDTVVDTVVYFRPMAKDSAVVRYVAARLSVIRDTVFAADTDVVSKDTVRVEIPIMQKVYKDSLYEAWVSGYEAQLDSIKVITPTVTVTKRMPKRWGLGVQAGYGTGGAYLGIGVTYNIFTF